MRARAQQLDGAVAGLRNPALTTEELYSLLNRHKHLFERAAARLGGQHERVEVSQSRLHPPRSASQPLLSPCVRSLLTDTGKPPLMSLDVSIACQAHRRTVRQVLRRDPFAESREREVSARDKYKPTEADLTLTNQMPPATAPPATPGVPGAPGTMGMLGMTPGAATTPGYPALGAGTGLLGLGGAATPGANPFGAPAAGANAFGAMKPLGAFATTPGLATPGLATPGAAGGGLFGAAATPAVTPGFGAPATGGGLFGAATPGAPPAGGGLFGAPTMQPPAQRSSSTAKKKSTGKR